MEGRLVLKHKTIKENQKGGWTEKKNTAAVNLLCAIHFF